MKLTARQIKFLKLASDPGGICPWDMPPGGPYMKNHEMAPLTAHRLVVFERGDHDVWVATAAGKLAARTGRVAG